MAKLNKSEANEAMNARLLNDADVQGANGAELRLMTYEQLRDSARRVVMMNHGWLIENTFPKYRVDLLDRAQSYVLAVWRRLIESFENTDPTCIAERKARSFVHMVDRMVEDADEDLAGFQKNFTENPFYALENSRAAMEAAANKDMALKCRTMLEVGVSVDDIKAHLMGSLKYCDGVRLSGSTCPTTNLMARARLMATMKLAGLGY